MCKEDIFGPRSLVDIVNYCNREMLLFNLTKTQHLDPFSCWIKKIDGCTQLLKFPFCPSQKQNKQPCESNVKLEGETFKQFIVFSFYYQIMTNNLSCLHEDNLIQNTIRMHSIHNPGI